MTIMIQARMTSQRCPGKSLKTIDGVPLVQGFHDNIKRQLPEVHIVFLIPDDPRDDELATFLEGKGIDFLRGSSNDVLARYAYATEELNLTSDTDLICRLTGDCLFFDGNAFRQMLKAIDRDGLNYISNRLAPTFPDGLDIEIFRALDLLKINILVESDFDREHVTPFFYRENSDFSLGNFISPVDLSSVRLTFDYPTDFSNIESFLLVNETRYFDLDVSEISALPFLDMVSSIENKGLRSRVFKESKFPREKNFRNYADQGIEV